MFKPKKGALLMILGSILFTSAASHAGNMNPVVAAKSFIMSAESSITNLVKYASEKTVKKPGICYQAAEVREEMAAAWNYMAWTGDSFDRTELNDIQDVTDDMIAWQSYCFYNKPPYSQSLIADDEIPRMAKSLQEYTLVKLQKLQKKLSDKLPAGL